MLGQGADGGAPGRVSAAAPWGRGGEGALGEGAGCGALGETSKLISLYNTNSKAKTHLAFFVQCKCSC